ncbi:hypothetical protein ACBW95_005051 [Salmonella enterica subsp. enterica serovar Poona]|nr:hypothetical protein [Salmonella enterica]EKO0904789.1 hypothetical protein [Salmonella enterica subsp. enterica]
MTTITKEWLQQTIAEFENTRDDIPFGLDDDDAKILIVLKRALASLEAEPVAYNQVQRYMMRDIIVRKMGGNLAGEKLVMDDIHAVTMALIDAGFRAFPPAPVVPDYASFEEFWSSFEHPFAEDDELKSFAVEIWNVCRAAMLNGGKS